jgi:hypothetical protein
MRGGAKKHFVLPISVLFYHAQKNWQNTRNSEKWVGVKKSSTARNFPKHTQYRPHFIKLGIDLFTLISFTTLYTGTDMSTDFSDLLKK